jgi:hypothetical protein
MNAPKNSKVFRRTVFWLLVLTTLTSPICFLIMLGARDDPFGLGGFWLLRITGGSIAFLLLWCAKYNREEASLVRIAILLVVVLNVFFFFGVTAPVF